MTQDKTCGRHELAGLGLIPAYSQVMVTCDMRCEGIDRSGGGLRFVITGDMKSDWVVLSILSGPMIIRGWAE